MRIGASRIVIPLDVPTVGAAVSLVNALGDRVGMFKVGLEWITSTIVSLLTAEDYDKAWDLLKEYWDFMRLVQGRLFYDGKWDDIPKTTENTAVSMVPLSPTWTNVHASSGLAALKSAVKFRGHSKVFGVTVLTSIDEDECQSIFGDTPGNKVLQFARMLVDAGAQGIICSPKELEILQGIDLLKATPGVRPVWASTDDQKRVMTPAEAVAAGGDFVIIGRPVTKPPEGIGSPAEAADLVADEIEEALSKIA